MKPSFELVQTGDTTSVKVKTYTRGSLNVPLHFHPEHEMVLVVSGRGKVIVADVAASFAAGDLLLIGGNVPHLYVDDEATTKRKIKVVVIQFKEKLFDSLLQIPEFYRTGKFLAQMRQGVKVSHLNGLEKHLTSLVHKRGVDKFNTLLYILDNIVRKGRYQVIAQAPGSDSGVQLYSQRLRDVYSIVQKNYTRDITVDEVAAQVHLSKTSFCRFLKKEAGKTFTELLNEERIKYACALLRETTLTVTQVSYQSGFNNPSHFFRQFRKMKKVSPNMYKQRFRSVRRWRKVKVQE
jgi:AraC-like DNA-binding protein/mannose-6-phosphate isomerase-like protein (cupin superfamily)